MPRNLPHAERAVVPREKLEGYLLNLGHEVGRHKPRVFGAAARHPSRRLAVPSRPGGSRHRDAQVSAVRETPRGSIYEIVVPIEGLNGQSRRVMTVWLVASSSEPPRFVTGYVIEPPPDASWER